MRLIDADIMRQNWLENGQNEYIYNTNAVLDSIDAQPTIEAEPVRHARWYRGQCTNCKTINPAYKQDWNGDYIFKETLYCPECGAKMDLPS